MRIAGRVLGPLFLLVAAAGQSAGESADVVGDRIRRIEIGLRPAVVSDPSRQDRFSLEERMRFYKTPAISIAVINNGTLEWSRGYGVREVGTAGRVTRDTLFQAASISKPVAALVALRLVEQGKLGLDEDVNRRLVSWKLPDNQFTKDKKVTLRWLLSHRGGLTDHAGFLRASPTEQLPTLKDILETGKWTPAPIRVGLEPGSRFRYSGGGYCLMEQLLEDISGRPFATLARELVFESLSMTNSSFEQPLPAERAVAAAIGHFEGKPLPQKWNIYPASSAAGLWTTPSDLARFAVELQQPTLLSPSMRAQMLSVQGHADDRDSKAMTLIEAFPEEWPLARGLGVGLIGQPPLRFYHTGSNPGYQCELQAYIEGGKGAVVMTNADEGWRLGREVLWAIAEEYDWPGYDYQPEVRMARTSGGIDRSQRRGPLGVQWPDVGNTALHHRRRSHHGPDKLDIDAGELVPHLRGALVGNRRFDERHGLEVVQLRQIDCQRLQRRIADLRPEEVDFGGTVMGAEQRRRAAGCADLPAERLDGGDGPRDTTHLICLPGEPRACAGDDQQQRPQAEAE
jgi:CubicO group peptidase (beta-lactamase class C family)